MPSQGAQLGDPQGKRFFHGVNDQGQSQEAFVLQILGHVSRCLTGIGQLAEDFGPVHSADVSPCNQGLFDDFGTGLSTKKGQER